MSTFFNGWRRKAGSVTLVMALIVFIGWMRSHVVYEVICFANAEKLHSILTMSDGLSWLSWNMSELDGSADTWQSFEASGYEAEGLKAELAGIRALRSVKEWSVSWPLVVLGLSFLSAYLLFWPGKSKAVSVIEPD